MHDMRLLVSDELKAAAENLIVELRKQIKESESYLKTYEDLDTDQDFDDSLHLGDHVMVSSKVIREAVYKNTNLVKECEGIVLKLEEFVGAYGRKDTDSPGEVWVLDENKLPPASQEKIDKILSAGDAVSLTPVVRPEQGSNNVSDWSRVLNSDIGKQATDYFASLNGWKGEQSEGTGIPTVAAFHGDMTVKSSFAEQMEQIEAKRFREQPTIVLEEILTKTFDEYFGPVCQKIDDLIKSLS